MSALHDLARRLGIVDEYVDQSGTERRVTSDETRVALLAALGVEAHDEAACRRSLEASTAAERARSIAPTLVTSQVDAPLEVNARDARRWQLHVRPEVGEARELRGVGDPGAIALGVLAEGYHDLELSLDDGEPVRQRRIVVPRACPSVRERVGVDRAFGVALQLYALRGTSNWGIGDLRDLEGVVRRAGAWGAKFVGVNPLHALTNVGAGISPYSPISRLYRNWLYLDLGAMPEFDGLVPPEIVDLRRAARVDYEAIAPLKEQALRRAHARFQERSASDPRRKAFEAYVRAEGTDLRDFATFSATSEAERRLVPHPRAAGADELRRAHRRDIDFHTWVQFELDRQLASVACVAREAGVDLGLYQDLAIGCAPNGSDAWANPGLFVDAVGIGAPPDSYSAEGQNWGLPPLLPQRLRESGYRYWVRLLRHALAHSGALRIDHVIGLFRQFWIPAGKSGKEGAFVEFPSADLLGILALEAKRANAVVVGEDLGTVPDEVPGVLARHGVLSSRVLYFEMTEGAFKPAADYPPNALTTANTHDMAPLAGWWLDRDVELKLGAGIVDQAGAAAARAQRADERAALVSRLRDDGLIDEVPARCDAATIGAVHAFLASTPSTLVGVSLDDILGETEPVNVPGADLEHHPSWQRKYSVSAEALPTALPTIPDSLRRRR